MPLAQEPLVCAVMLTRDRPEMAARAIQSFQQQTYSRRHLLIFDTGKARPRVPLLNEEAPRFDGDVTCWAQVYGKASECLSIGALRNAANITAPESAQIFIHWDDDDWSHPNRIAEQVALLQASGKECVGYKDLLFWNTQFPKKCPQCKFGEILRLADGSWTCRTGGCEFSGTPGEAWLWKHPLRGLAGTSLCYWRKTWEQWPFPDLPKNNASEGEDTAWLRGVDSLGVSSVVWWWDDPRMIASIHGSNTMAYTEALLSDSTSWARVPQFDQLCRERMAL